MPRIRQTPAPCCEHCGGPLEHFEGEPYCPDCLRFTLAPEPPAPAFTPGQSVTWRHVPRRGWGYVFRVPAVVRKVGRSRLQLAARTTAGGERLVWVRPASVEPAPA